MIKFTGCLLIVVCTTAAGIFCSEKFRLRTVFYEQYLLFLTNAGTFISYTAASIGELLSMNISAPMIEPILKEAKHSLENGSEFSCAWRKAVENGQFVKYFGYPNEGEWDEQKEILSDKGFGIGRLKTCPKGFPKDYEFIDYLRMKDYAAWIKSRHEKE